MRSTGLLLALLAPACATNPSGIWLFQANWSQTADCIEAIDENFVDGYAPADSGGAWTEESQYASTDLLSFAQIVTTTRHEAVMVLGDRTLPGTWAAGEWSFAWAQKEAEESRSTHESGYTYAEYWRQEEDTEITFAPEGRNRASGDSRITTVDVQAWEESDTWSDDAADYVGWTGDIPSETYLVQDDEDWGGSVPQRNYGDDVDCADATCQIIVTTTCQATGDFTATRTDYDEEDAYGFLRDLEETD